MATTLLEAIDDPRIFGKWFASSSWDSWRAFLAALFALPMTPAQLALFQKHTGRTTPPREPYRECWTCTGRRAGKSLIAALISVYLSAFKDYSRYLGPGEYLTGMVVSPDRKQSRVIRRFQGGFIGAIPSLASLLVNETKESLQLSSQCVLETQTASSATLRGYTSHVIVNDEIAFLPTESSTNPDEEILIAERPCLASIPGSLLLSISSPYARRGELYRAFENHYGKDASDVLFWKASSLEMNPSLDPRVIAEAYEWDPAIAAAEWGGDFRSDCERLFTLEALDACTDYDRPLMLLPDFTEEEVAR
jgi:hypothetical protein